MAPRRVSLPGLALLAVFAMYALQHVTMFVGPSAQHGSTSASMIKGQRLSVVVHARGGARGGVAETQSPLSGILLALGACIGLYCFSHQLRLPYLHRWGLQRGQPGEVR